jgi:hypothetical protein
MRHQLIKISILILAFPIMADGHPQISTQPAPFKSGQSVYLVAMKSNCSPDFAIERDLRIEFEKNRGFKVATSLQSADFVFVVYLDYGVRVSGSSIPGFGGSTSGADYIKSVTAFAVSPATYTNGKSDLYKLRDEALWKSSSGEKKMLLLVVKRFHDYASKK